MKIGELAKKTGLTVRALHHYDAIGLVKPSSRSHSGHRVYTAQDILTLEKTLALQQLGLSLTEIKECLAANALTFHEIADKQMRHLEEKITIQKRLHQRLQTMCTLFVDQDAIPVEELIKIIKVMTMYEKYYTPEQLEKLNTRQATYTQEQLKKIEKRWDQVFQGISDALKAGLEVSDPKVIALGKEANALIDEFTGKDPDIEKSFKNMYATEGGSNVLKHHGVHVSQAEFDFLKSAMIKAQEKLG